MQPTSSRCARVASMSDTVAGAGISLACRAGLCGNRPAPLRKDRHEKAAACPCVCCRRAGCRRRVGADLSVASDHLIAPFPAGGPLDASPASSPSRCALRSASRWWSRTSPAPAAISASAASPAPRPTATPSASGSGARTSSTRSPTICPITSSTISSRLRCSPTRRSSSSRARISRRRTPRS